MSEEAPSGAFTFQTFGTLIIFGAYGGTFYGSGRIIPDPTAPNTRASLGTLAVSWSSAPDLPHLTTTTCANSTRDDSVGGHQVPRIGGTARVADVEPTLLAVGGSRGDCS